MLKLNSSKGQLSIITRIFFIVAMLVLLVIFAAQITFYNTSTKAQTAKYDLVFFAEDLGRVLTGSLNCLSAGREGVLDEGKLDIFSSQYSGSEAECARLFGYGWNARVDEVAGGTMSWSFGSQVSETPSIKIKVPVSIRSAGGDYRPALLTLQVASGELEQVAGLIDSSCANSEPMAMKILLKDRIAYENGMLCSLGTKKICRKLACAKEVAAAELIPGAHSLRTRLNETSLELLP